MRAQKNQLGCTRPVAAPAVQSTIIAILDAGVGEDPRENPKHDWRKEIERNEVTADLIAPLSCLLCCSLVSLHFLSGRAAHLGISSSRHELTYERGRMAFLLGLAVIRILRSRSGASCAT